MDTVHECDGQTDGQTDRITITKTVQRIASHGINTSDGPETVESALTKCAPDMYNGRVDR